MNLGGMRRILGSGTESALIDYPMQRGPFKYLFFTFYTVNSNPLLLPIFDHQVH
jgi:hypothetical protein